MSEDSSREILVETAVWPDDLIFDPRPDDSSRPDGRSTLSGKNARRDTCRSIINAIGGISILGPPDGVRWRGQGDSSWRLNSGATRAGIAGASLIEHEAEMLRLARQIGMDDAQHMGDWEILARLRHSGAATRLIDITTDPFVALYMLCDAVGQPGTEGHDGLLLAVRRSALRPINKPWRVGSFNEMVANEEAAALVFSTPPIDPRIAAQRGEFMLSTSPLPASVAPHCELFKIQRPQAWSRAKLIKLFGKDGLIGVRGKPQLKFPDILGILVPSAVKDMLREMLRENFGFTRESIYPDWAGLAEAFKWTRDVS